jgi:hypothetical protein
VLFESTLTAATPIYRKIAEFPFVTPLGDPVGAGRPMFAGKI